MAYPYVFDAQDPATITGGGYCDVPDVQSLFKNISLYQSLDSDEIMRRISDAAAEIDACINRLYITPVTADQSALNILRLINSRLAAADIHEVYYRGSEPQASQGTQWRTFAQTLLTQIETGAIYFFSAPTPTQGTEQREFPSGAGATINPDTDMDVTAGVGPLVSMHGPPRVADLGDIM